MIICTSLHPNHACKENQAEAIKSWKPHGECFSLNSLYEIPKLNYDIVVCAEEKTAQSFLGKPLINLHSVFKFADKNDLLVINSDIILTGLPTLREDGITIMSRYDYTNSFDDAELFKNGFDVFYIPNKFLTLFPISIYCIGAAWWDYWLPKIAMQQNIPLYYPRERYAYHKKHPQQYNHEEWLRLGEYFKLDFNINRTLTVPQVATLTLAEIKSKLIHV